MKKILLFAFVVFIGLSVSAQEGLRIDSLKALIANHEMDTNRIETMIYLVNAYSNAYENDSVIVHAYKVLDAAQELDFGYGIASAERDLGIGYWGMGELDSAAYYTERAIATFGSNGDSTRLVGSQFNLGLVLSDKGESDRASEYFFLALEYFLRVGKKVNASIVLNSIGYLQKKNGDLEGAIESFEQAIMQAEEGQSRISIANAKSNLGDVLILKKDYDRAESLFLEVLQIDRELELEWGIGFQLSNLGNLYAEKGEYGKAIDHQLEALEIRRRLGEKLHLASNLTVLGRAYVYMKDYRTAVPYLNEASQISRSIGSIEFAQEAEELLSECHEELGDYESALHFMTSSSVLRDSLNAMSRQSKLDELTAEYRTEKKEAEIALLSKDNELKDEELKNARLTRFGLIGGIFLVLLMGYLLWMSQRRKIKSERTINRQREALRTAQFQESLKDLELKALRAQMNPHFVFNALNSVNRLILEGDNDKASQNLTKFSNLVRMILEHSERERISLKEEIDMLRSYVELEAVRFKGAIDFRVDLDDSLDLEETTIPPMLLQPIVENSIWHGIMHKKEKSGRIDLSMSLIEDELLCVIKDDGVGIEQKGATDRKSHSSMATRIIKERLEHLSRSKAQIFDIKDRSLIESGTRGTQVTLKIPA